MALTALAPTLQEIIFARARLDTRIKETPVVSWDSLTKDNLLGKDTQVYIKLELFQFAGSFKPRGALLVMMELDEEGLKKGVTAVSAGNHAIAVGYAAQVLGTHAKVVMPRTANPFRIQRCRELGTEVVLVENVVRAFEEVSRIQREEGRTFVHPFEGPLTALGTATIGLEYTRQVARMDAVIIPVGGGGLAGGMACAIRQINPECRILGVEPVGADTMYRSFISGKPESLEAVRTIADSLGSPFAMPYSLDLCRRYLEKIVLVEDDEIRNAMRLMFNELKLAAEPAAAASLAALLGPLREELKGKKVGLIACGSNIDLETFYQLIKQ
ncbi:MAG: pyridoxal-phosphate dependent enzyme [Bacteroidia bacterium]|nr:pyridoxal-phosphate dependent enzyme [Bacteroidia bacterium]